MKKKISTTIGLLVALFAAIIVLSACGENNSTRGGENNTAAPQTVTVTFNTGGGSEVPAQSVEKGGKAIKPQDPVKNGYNFTGWTCQGEEWSFIGYSVTENITLDANWTLAYYSIYYILDGGTYENGPNPPVGYSIESSEFTLLEPIRPCYTFLGWTWDGQNVPSKSVTIASGSYGNKTFTANWSINYDEVFIVSGNSITRLTYAGKQLSALNIPNEINGTAITNINAYAFEGSLLTSITIPSNITSIEEYAFKGCEQLMTVNWNTTNCSLQGLSSDRALFKDCTNLKTVNIGENVTTIPAYAFYGCDKLTNITISNGVTNIGAYAFQGCSSLTNITIPNSISSIGTGAFRWCSSLTNITIPNSISSIGTGAFRWCSNLQYNGYDNALCLGNDDNPYLILVKAKNTSVTSCAISEQTKLICEMAFQDCSSLTNIAIPNSVTCIGDSAFSNCSELTSVTIGNGVTDIGFEAFYNCRGLTHITIPNSVTSIEEYAFSGCWSLIEVCNLSSLTIITGSWNNGGVGFYAKRIYADGESYLQTENGNFVFFYDGTEAYLVKYNGDQANLHLPANYDGKNYAINYGAFYGNSNLTNILIPSSVTSIGSSAFRGCSGLTNILIPSSVTSIGSSAFRGCSGLTNILIPSSVTSIGSSAFRGCSGLANILIPSSVTSIGSSAFRGCSGLTSVTFANTNGWYISLSSDTSNGTDMDVTNANKNATYLTNYYDYYWYRK